MPAPEDMQVSPIVQLRAHAVQPPAQQPLGEDEIQVPQGFHRVPQPGRQGRHLRAEGRQDAFNFPGLLQGPQPDERCRRLLGNGQLACTGGGINDNTDAQRRDYLVTPPVAGIGDEDTPDGPTMSANVLVVTTKDGSQTTYLLLEKPQVRFEGKQLRVVSAKADVTYQLTDILHFPYTKRSVSGIDEQVEPQAGVDYQDGVLVISQLKAGATVGVYALDGKLVRQLTAQHTGTFRLNLSALPQGVYIVKADNVSYKIMKR